MVVKWLFLPFGAAFRSRDGGEEQGKRPKTRPSGGDGGIDAIPKHERATDYANKNEEDAVEDYNAPMYDMLNRI